MKKCSILFVLAAAIASAASYRVNLLDPTVVNGTELKPGEYRLEVGNDTAVFHRGKTAVEAPVKIANASTKVANTTFRYGTSPDGHMMLQSIQPGGSTTLLIFAN